MAIVLATRPTKEQVVDLVIRLGGTWLGGEGVLEDGAAAAYLTYEPDPYSRPSHKSYFAEDRALLGGIEPISRVAIHIGHGEGSDTLVRRLADAVTAQWTGAQDWRSAE